MLSVTRTTYPNGHTVQYQYGMPNPKINTTRKELNKAIFNLFLNKSKKGGVCFEEETKGLIRTANEIIRAR